MPTPPNQSATSDRRPTRELVATLLKHWRVAVTSFISVFLIVVLWTLLAPPTYESTASLLVKKGRAEVPVGPTESTPLIIPQVTLEDLNSEIEILGSRELIKTVVADLGVDEASRPDGLLDPLRNFLRRLSGSAQLSYEDEMVLELERELMISRLRKSNIIGVGYRHRDPEWATRVVKAVTEHYLERRNEIYQSPGTVSFFENQMLREKERLSRAEQATSDFLEATGLTLLELSQDSDPLAAQKDVTLKQLGELETRLSEARSSVRELEKKVSVLQAGLAEEPERLPSSDRFNQNSSTEELEKGLVALQLRRDALIQDFSPGNRQVQDVESQIRLARERLDQAEARIGSINRTEINAVHQALRSDLVSSQTALEGALARVESLQAQIRLQQRGLADLNRQGFELERLRREAKAAERSYLLYQQKHEEARISAAMDQHKIVNVSIAQPAKRPLRPVHPKRILNLFVGLVLAALSSVAVTFGMEYFDHTHSTAEDLERIGIPHLASIPERD